MTPSEYSYESKTWIIQSIVVQENNVKNNFMKIMAFFKEEMKNKSLKEIKEKPHKKEERKKERP